MADRLRLWLAGFSVGRYEKPQYAHPGELKADIRKVLAERDRYREALLAWTFDHDEDGPCGCTLCLALSGPESSDK